MTNYIKIVIRIVTGLVMSLALKGHGKSMRGACPFLKHPIAQSPVTVRKTKIRKAINSDGKEFRVKE
ncbi:hypothetical protein CEXT_469661 [Caerostris extrusa]|uniref:Uncharacterized protein n=1 Tax=Caerostris extrusa TaxID=172846 RepID=A0AAV4VZ01_CAEEX|nr:hypothetical protein CEXT_469661 [Caerostris extrusa]